MRGRQINFYITPEDLKVLEGHLRSIVDILAFEVWVANEIQERHNTEVTEMGVSWLTIGLMRPTDTAELKFRRVEGNNRSVLDIIRSPAIEFTRCFFDGNILRRGRFYYVPEYFDNGRIVRKSTAFINWSDKLFNASKTILIKDRGLGSYVGPNADKLRREGKCKLLNV